VGDALGDEVVDAAAGDAGQRGGTRIFEARVGCRLALPA
jgi:hypothetical protein